MLEHLELACLAHWLLVINSQRTGNSTSARHPAQPYRELVLTTPLAHRWTHRPASVLVYMAKCPGDCNTFDGSGKVWCKSPIKYPPSHAHQAHN